ncbi:MAG TPA: sugar phosphate isomerase/epimerase [Chthonomonadaceae bacterium]|jgi:sugar phosphate isomerase/epimerase|nr:sugar phosphate isomerase/epimerase [Chthonomonadaceae bacterium]
MQLGCSTLLYGGHPLEAALSGIQAAGYKAIELAAIPGMADHLPVEIYDSDTLLAQRKQQIADYGLAIESIGASTDLLAPEARARFIRLMQAGQKLGAPAITTGAGGAPNDEVSFQTVVAVLSGLAPIAVETGVKISIKPHVGQAVYNTETALRLMQQVDTSVIGLNVDPSHLWRTPDQETPEESIPRLLPYLLTARIRDTQSREPAIGSPEDQMPGNGAMNLPAIIAAFKQKPDLNYLVLEIVGTQSGYSVAQIDELVADCYRKLAPMVEGSSLT